MRSFDPTGWPIGLGYMLLGLDCRLYVSPGSPTPYVHVVHQLDEKGAACLFEVDAINTPTHLAHHFPNIPNYHYPRGCDNTIGWGLPVAVQQVVPQQAIRMFPNPTQGKTRIQLGNNQQYDYLTVHDLNGKQLHQQSISNEQTQIKLDMSHWPSGTYFVYLRGQDTPQSLRLIKQ